MYNKEPVSYSIHYILTLPSKFFSITLYNMAMCPTEPVLKTDIIQ